MRRTITCPCGDVLSADDDEALFHEIRRHDTLMHSGLVGMSDEQVRSVIERQAQDAPPN